MISSMTGYGKAEAANEKYIFTIEMKAVNHRYLDINIRMPKALLYFENTIRNVIKDRLNRGKVDVFINYKKDLAAAGTISYDPAAVRGYLDCFSRMEAEFGVTNDVAMSVLAKLPGVFAEEEDAFEKETTEALLLEGLQQAIDAFAAERAQEGEKLKDNLLEKLKELMKDVDQIEAIYPQLLQEYRQKLEARMQELLENTTIDESRIVAEATLYADKTCVDEETVRLRTHIENMEKTLCDGGICGKKLDFLTQEMNRESNTILSKANSISITDIGIRLKTGIEKIREQIQNIE